MTDLSQPGVVSPIERARLSAELLQIRAGLTGTGLSPIERVRSSARGLAIRAQLGKPTKVAVGGEAANEGEGQEGKNGAPDARVGPSPGDAANGMPKGAVAGTVPDDGADITQQAPATSQEASQLPLYARRDLFHGTALPFTSFAQGERKGSGYDHQGKAFYLTTDKQGYARFFAMQAADKILNGPKPPEGEEGGILEAGGVILDVQLTAAAKIIDLTGDDAPPELVAMVADVDNGQALRDKVLALGYDGIAFVEPNSPEGVPVKAGSVTVALYAPEKATIPGFEEAGSVPALGLDGMAADQAPKGAEDAQVQTVEAAGLSIRVPLISAELVADYNRVTHMGKGRDINAELANSISLLLADLAGKKHVLDTPEQKAEATMLVEMYAKRSAENTRQELAAGVRNPSWFVTGRSGRDMGKAAKLSQSQADKSLEAYRRLDEFRASIAKTLHAMRPDEVKQTQAVSANLRAVADYVAMFIGYAQNKQVTLASDARKWASPKALKLIDQAYQADPVGTVAALKAMDVQVAEFGGLAALFGARSGAGKRIVELLDQTAVPNPEQRRAPAGGTVGLNGEFYKGGTILPTTTLPKGSTTATSTVGTGKQLIEPGVLAEPPAPGQRSLYGPKREFLVAGPAGLMADESKREAMVYQYGEGGPALVRAIARLYNTGKRWLAEGEQIEVAEADQEPAPTATTHQIVEYTTKKKKVLRGIIRTDLTLAEAKEIDPYTWRMNGGYFIREKHLSGDTSAIQAAPAPAVLTPEQEAEKQERDARVALERKQQAVSAQVGKLRAAGDKAIASGTEGMNADRKTNTSRRAGMAATAYARAAADEAADEADGKTLNSIADAIEVGAAGPLASMTSRAQLQELKSALTRAKYNSERGLTYSEQLARRGEPVGAELILHVSMPDRLVWSNRYKNAAMTLAKKAPTGNSKLIAALNRLGERAERWPLVNDGDIAITRKAYKVLGDVKETWDLKYPMEMLGRIDRLSRMGITNDAELQDACRALLPHLAAKQEESAVVKAERAIIGQKVGIDFFPTPAHVAQRMARLARIRKGMRVLEPSAGNGNLADAAAAAGGEVDVIEISSQLRDILTAKGYTAVAHDFTTFTPDEPYQAIMMNPPFSKRQDAEHIMRAYGMLAGGGTLVAIAGEGVFFGSDQKAVQFRAWLDSHNADVEKLEGGTFQDNALLAQTSVNARLIVLHK